MYHRVTELGNDPHLLTVTPEHFAEHMALIRNYCAPISLAQLTQKLAEGHVPNRTVAITFDDGYADNLHQAKPLLAHYDIPATVYITTDHLGGQREFWWDELDRLLLQPGTLPAQLELNLSGHSDKWDLGQAANYSELDYQRDREWHIEREDDPTMRHRLFRWLFERLIDLPEAERCKVLGDLQVWAGVGPTARPTHQSLTLDQAICLVQGGLVEVGAHTMTHPRLATLPPATQRHEIEQSKICLEGVLQRPITTFALPHGSNTTETIAILKETGFHAVCTSIGDAVWPGTDPLQLPRVGVRDWDRDYFAGWLRWWLDG